MPIDPDAFRAAFQEFEGGAPVPPVGVELLTRFWDGYNRLREEGRLQPNLAVGLGAIAGEDFDPNILNAADVMAASLRCHVLSTVASYAAFKTMFEDDGSKQKLFRAVATIQFNRDEFAEVLALSHAKQQPVEASVQMFREMREHGLDPDHPQIEGKLLAWIDEQR